METIAEFSRQLTFLSENEEIEVLIITGQGEKAFCSGADIRELALMEKSDIDDYVHKGSEAFKKIESFPAPVIGVINGYAFGAAFELLMACDIRFMAQETKIGQPAVRHGLVPPFGGTHRLPQIVGAGKAKEIIFSGIELSAEECLRINLVNRIFPRKELLGETIKFAETITQNKKYAVKLAKEAINYSIFSNNDSFEDNALITCLKNDITKKQLMSFFEKDKSEKN